MRPRNHLTDTSCAHGNTYTTLKHPCQLHARTHTHTVPSGIRRFLVDYLERYYDVADEVLITQVLEPSAMPSVDNITMDDIHVFLRAVDAHTDELIENPSVRFVAFSFSCNVAKRNIC